MPLSMAASSRGASRGTPCRALDPIPLAPSEHCAGVRLRWMATQARSGPGDGHRGSLAALQRTVHHRGGVPDSRPGVSQAVMGWAQRSAHPSPHAERCPWSRCAWRRARDAPVNCPHRPAACGDRKAPQPSCAGAGASCGAEAAHGLLGQPLGVPWVDVTNDGDPQGSLVVTCAATSTAGLTGLAPRGSLSYGIMNRRYALTYGASSRAGEPPRRLAGSNHAS